MVAAGKGQADRQGLREGCHPWGLGVGQRSHPEQMVSGEAGRNPRFSDKPPGPRLETSERQDVADAWCTCVFSPVLGCGWDGKSWEASGGCGEGATAP